MTDLQAVTNALPSVLRRAPTPLSSTLITGVGGNNFGLNWNGGGKYNIVGKIGSGTFATVYRVSSKRDGEVYAAKHLEKQRAFKDGMIDRKFYNELNIMKRTHHVSYETFKQGKP